MATTISTALNEGTTCYVDIPQSRKEALMGSAPICAHKRGKSTNPSVHLAALACTALRWIVWSAISEMRGKITSMLCFTFLPIQPSKYTQVPMPSGVRLVRAHLSKL